MNKNFTVTNKQRSNLKSFLLSGALILSLATPALAATAVQDTIEQARKNQNKTQSKRKKDEGKVRVLPLTQNGQVDGQVIGKHLSFTAVSTKANNNLLKKYCAKHPLTTDMTLENCHKITDLAPLAGMSNLRFLDISFDDAENVPFSFNIPERDLSPLLYLQSIEYLALGSHYTVEQALDLSRKLPHCTIARTPLELYKDGQTEILVRDEGRKYGLSINFERATNRVDNDVLREYCEKHPEAASIYLEQCNLVTDLSPLKKMQNLVSVMLSNKNFTQHQLLELSSRMPDCWIHNDSNTFLGGKMYNSVQNAKNAIQN